MVTHEISMNNRAVELLHLGFPGEAIEILRTTLSHLKDSFFDGTIHAASKTQEVPQSLQQADVSKLQDSDSSLMDYSMSEDSEDGDNCCFDKQESAIRSVPIPRESNSKGSPFQYEGYMNIYDRAFVLPGDEADTELVSAVVLFNMGLINQSRGIQLNKSYCLKRALELYKVSLQMYQRSKSEAFVDTLGLAILNNSAQIYFEMFAFDEMRQCLDCVREIIEESEGDVDEDYSIFHLNAAVCTSDKLLHAPAA